MWDVLIKGGIALGGVVAGYLVADKVTEVATGKHIHQHLFAWWCRVRDAINAWVSQNRQFAVARYIGYINEKADEIACNLKKKIDLQIWAVDNNQVHQPVVTETSISVEELAKQYPGFKVNTCCTLEDLN